MIKTKVLKSPRFQSIDVKGNVRRITVRNIGGFYPETSLEIELSHLNLSAKIDESQCKIKEKTISLSSYSEFAKTLMTCQESSYWEDEDIRLFYFILIRFSLHMIDKNQLEEALFLNKDESKVYQLFQHHHNLTEILVQFMQAAHLKKSPYVQNGRAKALLTLGLDPKEKYEIQEVNKVGKNFLKKVHPDLLPNAEWIFYQINDALSYLKR